MLGCRERELLSDLEQDQAMRGIVLLQRTGITAERELQSSGRTRKYRLLVNENDYPRALRVLHQFGFPSAAAGELDDLVKPRGFVPVAPELARIRANYALAVQLERLLTTLPGVLDARVVVQADEDDGELTDASGSRASVVLRYASEGSTALEVSRIQEMVASAVPGLQAERVTVQVAQIALSALMPPTGIDTSGENKPVPLTQVSRFPFHFRVPETERTAVLRQLAVSILSGVVLAGVVGYFVGWQRGQHGLKRRQPGLPTKSQAEHFLPDANQPSTTDATQGDLPKRIRG